VRPRSRQWWTVFAASLVFAHPALGASERLTIFDLKLGATVASWQSGDDFKGLACGSNGGPPGLPLVTWSGFKQCTPQADGLHEVYFEYDDEAEYVARAHDDFPAGWSAGTAIDYFPIIASALFDDSGKLQGLRVVTDARPEQRDDPFLHFRPRLEHYLLALDLKRRFGLSDTDCVTLPATQGEGPVLGMFVKEDCSRASDAVQYTLASRLFRRLGETDIDRATGLRTEGAFVSETRAELRLIPQRATGH
jgi:hypothetical protein